MSILNKINKELQELLKSIGYEVDNINLLPSKRKDLGDFQINEAMQLAKKVWKESKTNC